MYLAGIGNTQPIGWYAAQYHQTVYLHNETGAYEKVGVRGSFAVYNAPPSRKDLSSLSYKKPMGKKAALDHA
jgi:hypothetical protein